MQARGMINKAVSQTMLLYVRKSWVVMGAKLKILEGFHHRAARQIVGMMAKWVADRTWEYPPVMAALEAAGLYPIHEYISRWKTTIAAYVEFCAIYEFFNEKERRIGTIRMMILWDQDMVQEYED